MAIFHILSRPVTGWIDCDVSREIGQHNFDVTRCLSAGVRYEKLFIVNLQQIGRFIRLGNIEHMSAAMRAGKT